MAAKQFYLPFRPALDANGIVVTGAELYFYTTGTTTPRTIYSNEALTVPLSNPVTANAAGVWPAIYLDDSITYRCVLKDSDGATLADQDPYLADVVDTLTPELQAIADQVAADAAATATNSTNAVNAVGAVLQVVEFGIQPDGGVSAGAWYAKAFLTTDTDFSLVRHWVIGSGTCDVQVNIADVSGYGPYAATTTPGSDIVSITGSAGDSVAIQIDNITGTPTAVFVQLEGLPA